MKRPAIILLAFLSTNISGQIIPEDRWSTPIKVEFNSIKQTGVDTLLVFYEEWGPWSSLPDSCNRIPFVWIIYKKDNLYYAKNVECDKNEANQCFNVSSTPIRFFAKHINVLEEKKITGTKFLGFRTDETIEHLVFMTSKKNIGINMSDFQREDINWRSLKWINISIQAIDTTKFEIFKNNVR